jgi:hypothetical protein
MLALPLFRALSPALRRQLEHPQPPTDRQKPHPQRLLLRTVQQHGGSICSAGRRAQCPRSLSQGLSGWRSQQHAGSVWSAGRRAQCPRSLPSSWRSQQQHAGSVWSAGRQAQCPRSLSQGPSSWRSQQQHAGSVWSCTWALGASSTGTGAVPVVVGQWRNLAQAAPKNLLQNTVSQIGLF